VQSKDAHAAYCKQSVKYRDYLNVLKAKVLSLGFPSLADYMELRYAGSSELFISPPWMLPILRRRTMILRRNLLKKIKKY